MPITECLIFEYNSDWVHGHNDQLCKEFGNHKNVKFKKFRRILVKDKSGKRYKTKWIKPDKTECISASPVSG